MAVDVTGLDYSKVFDKSRKAADTLSKGVQFLLKKYKAELIMGDAALSGKNEVTLKDGKKITGKNIIIATGNRTYVIPTGGRRFCRPGAEESLLNFGFQA